MSLNYYLVCHECKQRIQIAQTSVGRWSFFRGKSPMDKLDAWLEEHATGKPEHRFVLHSEHIQSSKDYQEIEWE